MKVDKIEIERGVSIEIQKGLWESTKYRLFATLNPEDHIEAVRIDLESIEDSWLREKLEGIQTIQPQEPTMDEPPGTGLQTNFDHLTWKDTRYGAYSFRFVYNSDNEEEVPEAIPLIRQLDPKGKEWRRIGNWEYRFGGDDFIFINRRKPKAGR